MVVDGVHALASDCRAQIAGRGELPPAGDTAYAGVAPIGPGHFLVTWYSSELAAGPSWLPAALGPTGIWQATIDLSPR